MKSLLLFHISVIVALFFKITLVYSQELEPPPSHNESMSSKRLYQQGLEASRRGAFSLASEYWETLLEEGALEYRTEWENKIALLSKLASVYQHLGMKRLMLKRLESALAIANEYKSQPHIRAIKDQLGVAYTYSLHHELAEQLLSEALSIANAEENKDAIALILMNLGNLRFVQERYDEAINYYKQSISMAAYLKKPGSAANLFVNAGLAAVMNQHYEDGFNFVRQGIHEIGQLDNSHTKAGLLLSAGKVFYATLTSPSPINHRRINEIYNLYQSAIQVAESINDPGSLSYAYGYLSELYEFEDHKIDALRLSRKATFYAQTANAREALYQWQWQTADLLKKLDRAEEAIRAYSNALQTVEAVRHDLSISVGNRADHRSFFESTSKLYFALADILLVHSEKAENAGQARKMLFRGREIVEKLRSAEIEDYLRDECANISLSARKKLDTVADHTAIVYIIPLPSRVEILVTFANEIHRYTAPVSKSSLFSEARRLRKLLETRPIHRYLPSAQKLYSWLIDPIYNSMLANGITTLVFITDGALREIPLSALHNGKEFLIQQFAIAVSPGLTLMEPNPLVRYEIDIIKSGISESVQGFPPLDYVTEELDAIHAVLGGKLLLNSDFLLAHMEKHVKENQYGIVHIASHGRFHSDPEQTFILTYDDRLTLNRLESILQPGKFRGQPIELLTLSACETAAGDDRAALGLAGVAMKSGARSVLATLWNINDQASSSLVVEFYKQLKYNPSISKAKALQQAQLALLGDLRYDHPCYWSPFLIIGNWL